MAVNPKPRPNPALRFGKPEKRNWRKLILFWLFVVIAVGASAWLFHKSPKLRSLECDSSSGMGTLTGFGGCHEG